MTHKLKISVALVVGALALSSCASITAKVGDKQDGVEGNPAKSTEVAAVTNVDSNPELEAGKRIQITAQDPWVLESVQTTDSNGQTSQPVAPPGTEWKSPPVQPQQNITVTATLRRSETGDTRTITREVRTGAAANTFTATIFPVSGTYGVGVIPTVTFSKAIPARDRLALTNRLTVTTSPTNAPGSWRWSDSTTVAYRPAKFWSANTTVKIEANIKNAALTTTAASPAAWGAKDKSATWKTGRSMIVNINSKSYDGTVVINGKVKRKFDVSLGEAGYITRSGIKTITAKHQVLRMTNIGVTSHVVYDLQVPTAMRITDTGEFLHGAPWNRKIGYAHTSKGCTNLRVEDARFIYDRMLIGDPVITTGTGRRMETTNGAGALWNIPASSWSNV